MNRTLSVAGLVVVLGSCSGNNTSGDSGGCDTNSECGAGAICDQGTCVKLCESDSQCPAGEICSGNRICKPGERSVPTIDGIDGDDTATLCPDAGGSHCIALGFVVNGNNLEGAEFTLAPQGGGSAIELAPREGSTDTQATIHFPDVTSVNTGVYTLEVSNRAGSADQNVELIQGPPGPTGPNLSGNEIVDLINGGTNTIQFGRLLGVAPLAHNHAAGDVTSDTFDIARLPVGDTDTSVAVGNHSHLQRGMTVNTVMVQTRDQGSYAAPNSGTGTRVEPLDLIITPKKAGNRIILEWVVHGEMHHDTVFLVQRNNVMLTDATNGPGTRWAGVAAGPYDNDHSSTPHNAVVRIIDMDCLSTETTYSLHVRSSSGGNYTFTLNQPISSAGQDAYETGLSTGIATEIWW